MLIDNNPLLELVSPTPPKFNSSPLKNGSWKTILSFRGPATFQGRTVKRAPGDASWFRNKSMSGFETRMTLVDR